MDNFELLKWDTEFFGFKVAIIKNELITEKELVSILGNLKERNVRLVYWATKRNLTHETLSNSYYREILVDRKITYKKKVKAGFQVNSNIRNFQANSDDENTLKKLALQAGEFSRFNSDPNIDFSLFQKLYSLWMENALKPKSDTKVLVYTQYEEILGMVTLKIKEGIGDIDLIAVMPKHRGKGVGKALLEAAENYFLDKTKEIQVVTQGRNKMACGFYESFGFKVFKELDFYHFWLK